ncbi:unnamed protein product, partial [Scytosiphon promiscuus]
SVVCAPFDTHRNHALSSTRKRASICGHRGYQALSVDVYSFVVLRTCRCLPTTQMSCSIVVEVNIFGAWPRLLFVVLINLRYSVSSGLSVSRCLPVMQLL